MNCPTCQKPLPPDHFSGPCPACGEELPAAENAASTPPPLEPPVQPSPQLKTRPIRWGIFFLFLCGPAGLAFFLGSFEGPIDNPLQGGRRVAYSEALSVFGGVIPGIVCGMIPARRVGRSKWTKIAWIIPLVLIFSLVSASMNFVGCITVPTIKGALGGIHSSSPPKERIPSAPSNQPPRAATQ